MPTALRVLLRRSRQVSLAFLPRFSSSTAPSMMATSKIPTRKLNSGHEMPLVSPHPSTPQAPLRLINSLPTRLDMALGQPFTSALVSMTWTARPLIISRTLSTLVSRSSQRRSQSANNITNHLHNLAPQESPTSTAQNCTTLNPNWAPPFASPASPVLLSS